MSTGNQQQPIGSWPEWARYVLEELKTLKRRADECDAKIVVLQIEMTKLQVKSGLWGAAAGAIPGLVAFMIWLLMK
jgi:hypothetical protein